MSEIQIRLARETDVHQIAALYRACYGDDYPFEEFYDAQWIKRGVYDSGIRWYVGDEGGRLLGSAAILLNVGDADDLVSEIGRLVVHPDARGRDLATKLVAAVTGEADTMSDFAFAECRTAHAGSQVIFGRGGYHVVGAEPLAYDLNGYESVLFVCRLSEGAHALRRGSPLVVPEVFELASHALAQCGIEVDVRVASEACAYTELRDTDDLELGPMTDRQRYRLLRLSRSHFLEPEVFGSVRLEHGHLKLKGYDAKHLVLRSGDAIVGGLGYTFDDVDRKVKLFEFAATDPRYKGSLIERGVRYIEETFDPRYIAVDVNAHAVSLQASLVGLGFAPCVYAPSMVYVMGERFDVVRMVKLRQEPRLDHWVVIDSMQRAASLVEDAVYATARGLSVDEVARRVAIFEGLSDVELAQLAGRCRETSYEIGEEVFGEGSESQSLFVVLEGQVEIIREAANYPVAHVSEGEIFGEMALIDELPRSAAARVTKKSRLLVLRPDDFDAFVKRSPRAGAVVLRNVARVLSQRLRGASDEGMRASKLR